MANTRDLLSRGQGSSPCVGTNELDVIGSMTVSKTVRNSSNLLARAITFHLGVIGNTRGFEPLVFSSSLEDGTKKRIQKL